MAELPKEIEVPINMGKIANELAELSAWIDTYHRNATRDAEANLALRVAKVAEEAGEAIKELIGITGQNPRKGVYGDRGSLVKELLDTAVTALAAVEHLTGNAALCMVMLEHHVEGLAARAAQSVGEGVPPHV